ncbi:MAG: AraC-type DNA-binding protein, partial [Acidobacteriaceae bacterium]|nr:AraC-type DNA-binding protein [Acidobacteriaceae bacterium]
MDPLSEVFGSMRIQEAVYKRLEATAPWGVRYSGDTGPRVRFVLVVRGSALLRSRNQRRTIFLSAGDLSISILNSESFTLMDDPRSAVVDSSEVLKLEVDG